MAPKITYFPLSGRGELCFLCAAGGGVEVEIKRIGMGPHKELGPSLDPPLPGTVPILQDGDLTLYQSMGIETYICNLSAKYKDLSPAEKAKDDMFSNFKEDLMQALAPYLFSKEGGAEAIPGICAKMLPIAEGLCPASGFVNGKDFPTKADLAILLLYKGFMPYQAAAVMGKVDFAAYPKMAAIAAAAAEADGIKEYIASDKCCLGANPLGLPEA
mmetsp:Transcript_22031/g.64880  ORF Transcript_22031/g.64880 Transcript_22031/m.64880 type:complete len:215 (-) Transcript_22031:119-763(-)